ncbi:MAG: ATP-dependent zinc protease [Chlamydiota bacterium]|nr:ATP-dependent zinc protease [Chlamydiota bacterium]
MKPKKDKINIGWQEWVALPHLHLPAIKAKIDTGAKTSSIHAFDIEPYKRGKQQYVKFMIHPLQSDNEIDIICHAPVIDIRGVMSSNAIIEQRYVIKSPLVLANQKWDIELTLSNRDPLRFRMLLGREALRSKVLIDPAKILLTQSYTKKTLYKMYS